jgi:3-polyprenyl-4-hydroxybenzoate decarboxylase
LQWALSSRVDPERDIQIISNVFTFQCDPSILARAADGEGMGAPPYASSMVIVDATVKCKVPEISLPSRSLMQRVLDDWAATGLPSITTRKRLERLLATHSDAALEFGPDKLPLT